MKYLEVLERILEEDDTEEEQNEDPDGDFAPFRDPDATMPDQGFDSHKLGELYGWNDPDFVRDSDELPVFREWNGNLKDLCPSAVIGRLPGLQR